MTCCGGEHRDFCVKAGATFNPTIRWGQSTLSAAAITAITNGTPVSITAPAHGMPNGWPAAVVGANGMSFINAEEYPPRKESLHTGTVVDANTVQFNDISSALWPAYTSGGSLVFYTPQPLAGVTFSMSFYDTPQMNDTPLVMLTNGSGITVDTVADTIAVSLQTTGLTWANNLAYYRMQATNGSGVVTEVLYGILTIE